MNPRKVVYKGEHFFLQSTGRYYQSGRKDSGERLLHRRIWAEANGPIPEGHQIHHKDGNWANNALDNLEMVETRKHQSEHKKEWMAVPENREKALSSLQRAQAAAAEWHKSDEGREWHRAHGKRTWEGREPVDANCSRCGKTYKTMFPSRSRFCSHSCTMSVAFQRHKTKSGNCALCSKEFFYNKYRKQECCSRTCANRLREIRKALA